MKRPSDTPCVKKQRAVVKKNNGGDGRGKKQRPGRGTYPPQTRNPSRLCSDDTPLVIKSKITLAIKVRPRQGKEVAMKS